MADASRGFASSGGSAGAGAATPARRLYSRNARTLVRGARSEAAQAEVVASVLAGPSAHARAVAREAIRQRKTKLVDRLFRVLLRRDGTAAAGRLFHACSADVVTRAFAASGTVELEDRVPDSLDRAPPAPLAPERVKAPGVAGADGDAKGEEEEDVQVVPNPFTTERGPRPTGDDGAAAVDWAAFPHVSTFTTVNWAAVARHQGPAVVAAKRLVLSRVPFMHADVHAAWDAKFRCVTSTPRLFKSMPRSASREWVDMHIASVRHWTAVDGSVALPNWLRTRAVARVLWQRHPRTMMRLTTACGLAHGAQPSAGLAVMGLGGRFGFPTVPLAPAGAVPVAEWVAAAKSAATNVGLARAPPVVASGWGSASAARPSVDAKVKVAADAVAAASQQFQRMEQTAALFAARAGGILVASRDASAAESQRQPPAATVLELLTAWEGVALGWRRSAAAEEAGAGAGPDLERVRIEQLRSMAWEWPVDTTSASRKAGVGAALPAASPLVVSMLAVHFCALRGLAARVAKLDGDHAERHGAAAVTATARARQARRRRAHEDVAAADATAAETCAQLREVAALVARRLVSFAHKLCTAAPAAVVENRVLADGSPAPGVPDVPCRVLVALVRASAVCESGSQLEALHTLPEAGQALIDAATGNFATAALAADADGVAVSHTVATRTFLYLLGSSLQHALASRLSKVAPAPPSASGPAADVVRGWVDGVASTGLATVGDAETLHVALPFLVLQGREARASNAMLTADRVAPLLSSDSSAADKEAAMVLIDGLPQPFRATLVDAVLSPPMVAPPGSDDAAPGAGAGAGAGAGGGDDAEADELAPAWKVANAAKLYLQYARADLPSDAGAKRRLEKLCDNSNEETRLAAAALFLRAAVACHSTRVVMLTLEFLARRFSGVAAPARASLVNLSLRSSVAMRALQLAAPTDAAQRTPGACAGSDTAAEVCEYQQVSLAAIGDLASGSSSSLPALSAVTKVSDLLGPGPPQRRLHKSPRLRSKRRVAAYADRFAGSPAAAAAASGDFVASSGAPRHAAFVEQTRLQAAIAGNDWCLQASGGEGALDTLEAVRRLCAVIRRIVTDALEAPDVASDTQIHEVTTDCARQLSARAVRVAGGLGDGTAGELLLQLAVELQWRLCFEEHGQSNAVLNFQVSAPDVRTWLSQGDAEADTQVATAADAMRTDDRTPVAVDFVRVVTNVAADNDIDMDAPTLVASLVRIIGTRWTQVPSLAASVSRIIGAHTDALPLDDPVALRGYLIVHAALMSVHRGTPVPLAWYKVPLLATATQLVVFSDVAAAVDFATRWFVARCHTLAAAARAAGETSARRVKWVARNQAIEELVAAQPGAVRLRFVQAWMVKWRHDLLHEHLITSRSCTVGPFFQSPAGACRTQLPQAFRAAKEDDVATDEAVNLWRLSVTHDFDRLPQALAAAVGELLLETARSEPEPDHIRVKAAIAYGLLPTTTVDSLEQLLQAAAGSDGGGDDGSDGDSDEFPTAVRTALRRAYLHVADPKAALPHVMKPAALADDRCCVAANAIRRALPCMSSGDALGWIRRLLADDVAPYMTWQHHVAAVRLLGTPSLRCPAVFDELWSLWQRPGLHSAVRAAVVQAALGLLATRTPALPEGASAAGRVVRAAVAYVTTGLPASDDDADADGADDVDGAAGVGASSTLAVGSSVVAVLLSVGDGRTGVEELEVPAGYDHLQRLVQRVDSLPGFPLNRADRRQWYLDAVLVPLATYGAADYVRVAAWHGVCVAGDALRCGGSLIPEVAQSLAAEDWLQAPEPFHPVFFRAWTRMMSRLATWSAKFVPEAAPGFTARVAPAGLRLVFRSLRSRLVALTDTTGMDSDDEDAPGLDADSDDETPAALTRPSKRTERKRVVAAISKALAQLSNAVQAASEWVGQTVFGTGPGENEPSEGDLPALVVGWAAWFRSLVLTARAVSPGFTLVQRSTGDATLRQPSMFDAALLQLLRIPPSCKPRDLAVHLCSVLQAAIQLATACFSTTHKARADLLWQSFAHVDGRVTPAASIRRIMAELGVAALGGVPMPRGSGGGMDLLGGGGDDPSATPSYEDAVLCSQLLADSAVWDADGLHPVWAGAVAAGAGAGAGSGTSASASGAGLAGLSMSHVRQIQLFFQLQPRFHKFTPWAADLWRDLSLLAVARAAVDGRFPLAELAAAWTTMAVSAVEREDAALLGPTLQSLEAVVCSGAHGAPTLARARAMAWLGGLVDRLDTDQKRQLVLQLFVDPARLSVAAQELAATPEAEAAHKQASEPPRNDGLVTLCAAYGATYPHTAKGQGQLLGVLVDAAAGIATGAGDGEHPLPPATAFSLACRFVASSKHAWRLQLLDPKSQAWPATASVGCRAWSRPSTACWDLVRLAMVACVRDTDMDFARMFFSALGQSDVYVTSGFTGLVDVLAAALFAAGGVTLSLGPDAPGHVPHDLAADMRRTGDALVQRYLVPRVPADAVGRCRARLQDAAARLIVTAGMVTDPVTFERRLQRPKVTALVDTVVAVGVRGSEVAAGALSKLCAVTA